MPEIHERGEVMEVRSKTGQGELIRDHVIPIMTFDKCKGHTGPLPTGKLNLLFLNLLLFHFFHSLFCSVFCNFLFYFFLTKKKIIFKFCNPLLQETSSTSSGPALPPLLSAPLGVSAPWRIVEGFLLRLTLPCLKSYSNRMVLKNFLL